MYYPMYFDPTYILIIAGMIISLIASARVKSTFAKYQRVANHSGMTGRDAAERILHGANIYDVRIERVSGHLTDHYDPRDKVLRLSDSTYQSASVASVGVAAHECGHAIQHATGYAPLRFSRSSDLFIHLGIIAFSLSVLFQLVTLPVEFNASRRAVRILGSSGMLYQNEVAETKKVLDAAALTYVASAAGSILQLLRILIIAGGRRGND